MVAEHLSGVIVLDKPPGISSSKALASVKQLLKARKAGHAGTLDPLATGVLVCCINRATKLARFLLHGRKKYLAVLQLGCETDTQDATGNIIATHDVGPIAVKQIRDVFKQFEGGYRQTPPAFSALKHKGKPLYKYARRGQVVQKPPRDIDIEYLRIVSIDLPCIEFEVACTAGTYVRTLCADIGNKLGCGGHLKTLRRLESSGFRIDEAISIPDCRKLAEAGTLSDRIVPMADALRTMPGYVVNKALTERIKHGRMLKISDLPDLVAANPPELFKLLDIDNKLIAVAGAHKKDNKIKYHCVFNTESTQM